MLTITKTAWHLGREVLCRMQYRLFRERGFSVWQLVWIEEVQS